MNRTLGTTLRRVAVLCLAAGLLAPLAAQETARTRARDALPPAVFQEMERLGAEMEGRGIPAELLYNKALEGMAKRVPTDRIVPAVQDYATRLTQARAMFGPASPPPMLVAGADALQRGVSADALQRLGAREDRSPMAVLVLAELVETGVPTDRALDVVGEALQRRTREREMLGIPEQVRQLMRQGRSAQEAAEQIRRALGRGRGGAVGPPVPPGSEPLTDERRRQMRGRPGGGA